MASCDDGSDELGCATAQFESIAIRRLDVSGGAEGRYETLHPIIVNLGIVVTGDPARTGLLVGSVGLVERNAADPATAHRCLLGGFDLAGPTPGEEERATIEVVVPAECLPEGRDEAAMAIFVELDSIGQATMGDGSPAQRLVVFDDTRASDHVGCTDQDEEPRCAAPLTLVASGGVDVGVMSMELGSSVAILFPDTLPVAWKPYPDGTPMPQFRPPLMTLNARVAAVGRADGEVDALDAVFSLRPVPTFEGAGGDEGFPWAPLTVDRGQREDADGHRDRWRIANLEMNATTDQPFDLYAEEATYALLAEGGEWAGYGVFQVRMCLETRDAEHRADGQPPDANNCAVDEVVIANARTPSEAAAASDTISYGVSPWNDRWGSTSTEQLQLGFGVDLRAGLGGVSTNNFAYARLRGWVDFDILDAELSARLPGQLNSNRYRVALTVLDDVVFDRANAWSGSHARSATNWPQYSWSDDACLSWTYTYIIDFTIRSCVVGSMGIDTSGSITAGRIQRTEGLDAIFDNTASLGLYARPHMDVDFTASAVVDAYAARGGATASVNIVDAALTDFPGSTRGLGPTASFRFENTTTRTMPRITYDIDLDAHLELSTLSGHLTLWAEYYSVLELEYVDWFNYRLATWSGLDASFAISHRLVGGRSVLGTWASYYASADGL